VAAPWHGFGGGGRPAQKSAEIGTPCGKKDTTPVPQRGISVKCWNYDPFQR
jgi:hypothetical protein